VGIRTWLRNDVNLVSPFVDWLMQLLADCVQGEALSVELALREALSNAILHGNRADARKLVKVRCCCERGKAVSMVVRDHGQGFKLDSVPDPLAPDNLTSDHGRGVFLMKTFMDDVTFERHGAEVRMRKKLVPEPAQTFLH